MAREHGASHGCCDGGQASVDGPSNRLRYPGYAVTRRDARGDEPLSGSTGSENGQSMGGSDAEARALFAGCAAHAFLPLGHPLSASFGWLLMLTGHLFGWPIARGGSQSIADALVSYIEGFGAVIETGTMVRDLAEIPSTPITILDVTPGAFAAMAGDRLPNGYLRRAKRFRHGPTTGSGAPARSTSAAPTRTSIAPRR